MAFRERFKDKMDVVGKNGEGAMLVDAEPNPKPTAKAAPKVAPKKAPSSKQPTKASMGANRTSVPIGGMPLPGGTAPMAPLGMPPAGTQPRTTSPGRGGTPQQAPILGAMPGAAGGMQPLGMMPGVTQPPMPMPAKTLGKAPPMPGGKKMAPLPGTNSSTPPLGGMAMPSPNTGVGAAGAASGSSPSKASPAAKKSKAVAPPIPPMTGAQPSDGDPDGSSEPKKYNYQKAADGTRRPATNQSAKGVAKFGRRANSQPPQQPPRPATEPKEPTYTPYSLDDYKKLKPIKRGGLGPTDTDEQRFYRIMRKKANEFGTASNRVNMAVIAAEGQRNEIPIEQPKSKEVLEKNERRLKALEYSRNVPKPKVREESTIMSPTGPTGGPRGTLPERGADDPMLHGGAIGGTVPPKDANAEMLMELEEKHRRDQEMIEAIKKQLKM